MSACLALEQVDQDEREIVVHGVEEWMTQHPETHWKVLLKGSLYSFVAFLLL
jgi:hypothetical protein